MFEVQALRPIRFGPYDFSLDAGECLVIRGPSGSGKTLLLRALADLDPSEGKVSLDGRDRNAVSGPEWRRQVRYVPAEPGWWDETPETHFRDPAALCGQLAAVGLSAEQLRGDVSRLSTGERQRLAILRAIEDHPAVLLLDEPTAALDQSSAKSVERLLKAELARGCIMVLVTHSQSQGKRFATQTLTLTGEDKREGGR